MTVGGRRFPSATKTPTEGRAQKDAAIATHARMMLAFFALVAARASALHTTRSLASGDLFTMEFLGNGGSASDMIIKATVSGAFAGGGVVVGLSAMEVITHGTTTVVEVTPPSSTSTDALLQRFGSDAVKNVFKQQFALSLSLIHI